MRCRDRVAVWLGSTSEPGLVFQSPLCYAPSPKDVIKSLPGWAAALVAGAPGVQLRTWYAAWVEWVASELETLTEVFVATAGGYSFVNTPLFFVRAGQCPLEPPTHADGGKSSSSLSPLQALSVFVRAGASSCWQALALKPDDANFPGVVRGSLLFLMLYLGMDPLMLIISSCRDLAAGSLVITTSSTSISIKTTHLRSSGVDCRSHGFRGQFDFVCVLAAKHCASYGFDVVDFIDTDVLPSDVPRTSGFLTRSLFLTDGRKNPSVVTFTVECEQDDLSVLFSIFQFALTAGQLTFLFFLVATSTPSSIFR